jgi:hypothetical protein
MLWTKRPSSLAIAIKTNLRTVPQLALERARKDTFRSLVVTQKERRHGPGSMNPHATAQLGRTNLETPKVEALHPSHQRDLCSTRAGQQFRPMYDMRCGRREPVGFRLANSTQRRLVTSSKGAHKPEHTHLCHAYDNNSP